MSKFLDETGLKALWAKIKALIPTSLPANGGNADTATTATTATTAKGLFFRADGSLKLYSMANASSGCSQFGTETVCLQSSFDDTDGQTHEYPLSWAYRCVIALQPRGGRVGINMSNPSCPLEVNGTIKGTTIYQNGTKVSVEGHTHTKSQITDFPSSLKNPNALVMQANGTQVGSYDGSSAVTVNITPSSIGAATSSHDHTTLNTAFKFNNNDISEVAGNLTGTATAHTINFYRNGFTIPYQMDNVHDGGMLRVRGTSESNTILELATWDDSGAGETIEFNYYPTTSRVTPTYSVVVPKRSGTIALTSDIPSVATTSANGLMSSTDKSNLDRSIYDVQDNLSGDTYKLNFYSNDGSNNTEIEIPVATTSAAGLMSKGDKANLDGAVTTAIVSGGGNAITTASISGHTLTLTKGSTFSLSNHTHSQYLTSVPVATTSALGGVKSTAISMHMTDRDYYAEVGSDGKICVNIPWTDTNTKNTAGSTNTSSKIYLIGATSQAANPQTYSNSGCYINTNGQLVSNGSVVITEAGGEVDELYCNGSITIDDELIMNDGTIQTNKLKLPTTSGGSTYGVGSSGQVLKSNGSTVYWANDNNTTYSAATTTTSGLMSANDKKLLNAVAGQNTFTYLRSATTSLYIPLFKFTKVATSLNGISVSIPPIMDIEFVIGYYNGSTVALGGQLKCTICLSSSPSIKWTVRNVTNSTYFGYIASLVYDKTNNAILLKCSSSAPAGVVVHAIAYNCAHSTVASYTSTSVGTISTFSVPTSVSIN